MLDHYIHRRIKKDIIKNVCLFVILYASARVAMILGAPVNYVALVWLPTGIATAAALMWGVRVWPAIFFAGLCVQLTQNTPIAAALGVAFANTIEAVLAAWIMRRCRIRPTLQRVYDVLGLALIGGVICTMLSATVGMGSLWLVGLASERDLLQRWLSWWLTDAGSILVVTPALLVFGFHRPTVHTFKRRWSEILALFMAIAVVGGLAFMDTMIGVPGPTEIFKPFLFTPFLVWAALRFGQHGTTAGVLGAASLVALVALTGHGPLIGVKPIYSFIYLELLVAIAAVTLMTLSAALAEQTKAMRCLKRGKSRLHRAKDQAETANRAKSAFIANMSHEIRTPLGAMLGFTDFLLDPEQSPENCHGFIQTIKRNGESLARMIDDVLDLSKVEAGHLDIETIRFSLADLLTDLSTLLSVKAREKGLTFRVRSDGLIPTILSTDPTRLRQILLNLVGNALKFTEYGSVDVYVKLSPSSEDNGASCAFGAEPELEFVVQDTGLGLTPEQVKRLFLPFSQADSSMTRRFGGTGLGLFLARKLAHALGGELHLEATKPGRGSIFSLKIPVTRADCAELFAHPARGAATAVLPLPAAAPKSPLKNLRILLVEDLVDNQILIGHMLRHAGCDLDLADGGGDGIEKAQGKHYDIILMDIQMPDIDGYAAMTALRRAGYHRPIIALTAHAMKNERERALREGFNDYLTKPVIREVMIATIVRWTALPARRLPGSAQATPVSWASTH